jgi:hypothetical protein
VWNLLKKDMNIEGGLLGKRKGISGVVISEGNRGLIPSKDIICTYKNVNMKPI